MTTKVIVRLKDNKDVTALNFNTDEFFLLDSTNKKVDISDIDVLFSFDSTKHKVCEVSGHDEIENVLESFKVLAR